MGYARDNSIESQRLHCLVFHTLHRIRLARPSLPIRKYRTVVALNDPIHQFLNLAAIIEVRLGGLLPKCIIKLKDLVRVIAILDFQTDFFLFGVD